MDTGADVCVNVIVDLCCFNLTRTLTLKNQFGSVRVHFQKTGSSSVRIDSNRTEPFSFGLDRFVFGLWQASGFD